MIAKVQDAPIDLAKLLPSLNTGHTGAMVTFHGIVRESDSGRKLSALQYEAYEEMAESELSGIANEAISEYDLFDVRIIHRIGIVEPGETSLFVAVEAEHRDRAFAGCTAVVDRIKEKAPIWKKDLYEEGDEKWHD